MNIMPKPSSNFTIIQNDIFNNYPDMSAKAKFMLLQVLSKPADWKLNLNWLVKQNIEGIHAVKSTVKEWEKYGFCHAFTIREDGRIKSVERAICYPALTRDQAEAHFNAAPPESKQTYSHTKYHEGHLADPTINVVQTDDHGYKGEEIVSSPANPIMVCQQETFQQVFTQQETAPIIINTDIKQILKETTTTPGTDPGVCGKAVQLSPSSFPNGILNLIPEKHRSQTVITFVNRAVSDYPAHEVKEAVAYAAGNVRGGSLQFRAYLDKTLKNKWAEGFLESMQTHHEPSLRLNLNPEISRRHKEGRAWLKGLALDSVKLLANSGNVAALEELQVRNKTI